MFGTLGSQNKVFKASQPSKRLSLNKDGQGPIQRLQDMRQQLWESFKNFLSRFIDEMTYYVQVTDREALTALRGGFDVTLFFGEICRTSYHL